MTSKLFTFMSVLFIAFCSYGQIDSLLFPQKGEVLFTADLFLYGNYSFAHQPNYIAYLAGECQYSLLCT